ncbi:TRAP transporter large permease [Methylobacterium terricola]|uniref:TRAP transporter large permease protein n=1 Tax=Methylobacterium terricola TaxID=2583531 RepID=A0A5C4LAJ2_9HYPH|nr:TRAP transporter large permease [Methylobacterium terricola]TNC08327.1 TRAP transporter large permease [Methylobacterium terricola]
MALLLGWMTVLLAIAVPIFAVMGLCAIVGLRARGLDLISVPQNVFEALDTFALLAIPFYVLAGNIMKAGGISDRLIAFATALLGWMRGGVGSAAILTCMFFSTITGSSSATTAAVGSTMIPAMERKGYPKNFAAASVAVGGELGAILPPSLPLVIYGLVVNVSIGSLFIAGILPGILIALSLILTICAMARLQDFDATQRVPVGAWARNLVRVTREAAFAIVMPVIILGGIYSGVFTATEASVVAVVYGFLVSRFVYRAITLRDVVRILNESAVMTGMVMLIVAFAALFGYALTVNQIPQHLGTLIGQVTSGPVGFLLLVNVLLFVVGTFMEALATILILGPILAPVAQSYGIDPVHLGIVFIVNVATGMVTPPVAINLTIASQVSGVPMDAMTKPLLVFLAVLTVDVLVISYVPAFSLVLLR